MPCSNGSMLGALGALVKLDADEEDDEDKGSDEPAGGSIARRFMNRSMAADAEDDSETAGAAVLVE